MQQIFVLLLRGGEVHYHVMQDAIDSEKCLRKPISNSELLDYAAKAIKKLSRNDGFMYQLTVV